VAWSIERTPFPPPRLVATGAAKARIGGFAAPVRSTSGAFPLHPRPPDGGYAGDVRRARHVIFTLFGGGPEATSVVGRGHVPLCGDIAAHDGQGGGPCAGADPVG